MRTVDELIAEGVQGRRVFLRADLNVPLDDSTGERVITDDGRIRASLPTLQALRDAGARVVVAAHLGRPEGRAGRPVLPGPGRRPAVGPAGGAGARWPPTPPAPVRRPRSRR